jgi:hypothetical protein
MDRHSSDIVVAPRAFDSLNSFSDNRYERGMPDATLTDYDPGSQ